MAHVAKFSKGAMGHMLSHYDRSKEGLGDNIEQSKTHLNYNLAKGQQPQAQLDFVHQRLSEVRCQNRKDVNVLCDWVVTTPKDLPEQEHRAFFQATYDFLANRYGQENVVSAYVHMDEVTPHMHFAFMPVTEDKKRGGLKVSAKEVLTRKDLQTFHLDLQNCLEKALGHEIGILNEATKEGNKTVAELKQRTIMQKTAETEQKAVEARRTFETLKDEVKYMQEQKTALEGVLKALEGDKTILKNEQEKLKKDIKYLKDRQKAIANRYEDDVFKLGVLHGEYTDGMDNLPEYAVTSHINRQKVVLPLEAYRKERRMLKAAISGEQSAVAALENMMQNTTMQHIKELEEREKQQRQQIEKLTERLKEMKREQEYNQMDSTIKWQLLNGINHTYRRLSPKTASEFVSIWKDEVREVLPVAWQYLEPSQQDTTHSKRNFKDLREETAMLNKNSHKKTYRTAKKELDDEIDF